MSDDDQDQLALSFDRTLPEVQDFLAEHRDEGVACPACHQFVKVYRRKLSVGTARVLIGMYQHPDPDDQGFIHIPSLRHLEKGGDTTKARYWQLIEAPPEPLTREDGSSRVGWWRLTDLGRSFVRGEVRVAKYARIYDGYLLELDDTDMVGIRDVLGTRFNYDDLMAGV